MSNWEGTIEVDVVGNFMFNIDEFWEAKNRAHAMSMVESELTSYLGDAWVEKRFIESWNVTEETK